MLSFRSQHLLKSLIERYIEDGQPVGSKTLASYAGIELSAASIRNVMAELEDLGLVASPHTSAGRVPTARGYRLFVDQLLTIGPLKEDLHAQLEAGLRPDSPQRMMQAASGLLSALTHFAGVVVAPQRVEAAFRHIEFLRLAPQRVLLILVTVDGDVRNHLLTPERDYSAVELLEAGNFLNRHYAGLSLSVIVERMRDELKQLRSDISTLMAEAIHTGCESGIAPEDTMLISGGTNLLQIHELSDDLTRLRELFKTFEHKTELLQLLNQGRKGQGVQLFIGDESGVVTLGECSVVTAPYCIDGQVVGTLGVIGPTRMAYEQVIPIVDITARLVSSALSYGEAEEYGYR